MSKLLAKLVRDEQGGEVLEYSLIMGLLVVGALIVMGAMGVNIKGRWDAISSALDIDIF